MKIDKRSFLLIALVLAVSVNTICLFTRPAYRYYRENFSSVRSEFEEFKRRVEFEFIPSITNLAVRFATKQGDNSVVSNSVELSRFDGTAVKQDSFSFPRCLPFRFFTCGEKNGVVLNGRNFFEGDLLFGSKIVFIDSTLVKTVACDFYYTDILGGGGQNSRSSFSPLTNSYSEVMKRYGL